MENFNSEPKSLKSSTKKHHVNLASRSLTMSLVQAKAFHHMTKKQIGYLFYWTCLGAAINTENLQNRSTITKMDLHSRALGNPMMKSMEMLCHGFSGIGRGCSNPTIFFLSNWHTKQDFTYTCTSSPILGQ